MDKVTDTPYGKRFKVEVGKNIYFFKNKPGNEGKWVVPRELLQIIAREKISNLVNKDK